MGYNITEAELNQAIAALQDKGIPDNQLAGVLQAMSFGEQSTPKPDSKGQASNLGRDALTIGMMASGNPLFAAITAASRQPAMSNSDSVVITQNQPDVSGVYVDATQKLQDTYTQSPMAQRQSASGMQQAPAYFNNVGDMNTRPIPLANPNARYEEPRTTTVDARGNIVIY